MAERRSFFTRLDRRWVVAMTVGAMGLGMFQLLHSEPDEPKPGDKFLVMEMIIDADLNIFTGEEISNQTYMLLSVSKIVSERQQKAVPYRLVVAGQGLWRKHFQGVGDRVRESGYVIEIVERPVSEYTYRGDGIKRYVFEPSGLGLDWICRLRGRKSEGEGDKVRE